METTLADKKEDGRISGSDYDSVYLRMNKLVVYMDVAVTGVKASLGQACQGQLISYSGLMGVQVG
ncbi:hypothetical protein BEL04_22035 [Mucilaginibacter sp. PPCGB 2223]|uniref:hypothetical protein n=1 Tax=Mucilaginibacter sp. PPCGB 2223 TaxID=1886027 RepID=UPI000825DDEB|nr:hypothetical protein [Mucilaginibacter sp. PPCGB 2223]OCX50464.1 hypothetical protein BEL04_22035 [Mucilaginibacter sp. PPCGB 2223]